MGNKAKTAVTVVTAGAMAIALPAIKKSEGYWPTVKGDKLANNLPTGGYGETVGVKMGETHDEKYWSDLLEKHLREDYGRHLDECIHVQLPDSAAAMAMSTAMNAGSGAVCASPMVRRWNAGDFRGGCNAMRGWRIGSHPHGPGGPLVVQPGLINRRNKDADKCIAGIDKPPKPVIVAEPSHAPQQAPAPVGVSNPPSTPLAPIAKAEPPPVPWWKALLARLRCWIFICEVTK
ncbi:glycoside hydrolase family protein [Bradyrhizobium sp. OK095]|uniref:lysozyme n=1 Tax=Bradyrhizobium sp. OK095 TaxID=1882760 RepID=UPI0008CF1D88|nr:glycoside hydrolase family protein [Bradyrhizobium sp. OK095]SEN66546.1 Phage-related lysozyme (muramidase), GH24 family [Bradyrhizobium sp. OK095]